MTDLTLEFHSTPQMWVAYRGCGCEECPKGMGRTKEEAVEDLIDMEELRRPAFGWNKE